MKRSRSFIIVTLAFAALLLLCSCGGGDGTDTSAQVVYYTVEFDPNGGSEVPAIKVVKSGLAAEPSAPVRDGYIFDGWALNGVDWKFSTDKVEGNITLTAKWIDAQAVYNYAPVDGGISITEIKRELDIMRIPSRMSGMTVVAIGEGAFEDTSSESVTEIIVPDTVTSIGKNAFANCAGVSITVEGSVTSLGDGAFKGCDVLMSITLGEGLTSVPYEAFSGCTALEAIRIPESVTVICENAFEECEALSSVMLHSTAAVIEDAAFRFCEALETVYYYGTEESFAATSIASGNDSLKEAELYLYSETEPDEAGSFWYLDSKGRVRIWK
ncbi:MAG: leucine-rich repeat protein [Clostridia bacterium]|nr:leucine-rich repeat protein [Clostridia bacterium]